MGRIGNTLLGLAALVIAGNTVAVTTGCSVSRVRIPGLYAQQVAPGVLIPDLDESVVEENRSKLREGERIVNTYDFTLYHGTLSKLHLLINDSVGSIPPSAWYVSKKESKNRLPRFHYRERATDFHATYNTQGIVIPDEGLANPTFDSDLRYARLCQEIDQLPRRKQKKLKRAMWDIVEKESPAMQKAVKYAGREEHYGSDNWFPPVEWRVGYHYMMEGEFKDETRLFFGEKHSKAAEIYNAIELSVFGIEQQSIPEPALAQQ